MSNALIPGPVRYPVAAQFPPETQDDGRREIWIGCAIAGAFFVLFLGWACFAPLDQAASPWA